MENAPSYDGSGLVNLIAEIEWRMTGSAASPRLSSGLAEHVPEGSSHVLLLFDGLGVAQLSHEAAQTFSQNTAGELEAPFPTTTTVSLATVASGLTPSRHGQVAHLTWYPDLGKVVNTLKWVDLAGRHVAYDYGQLLPTPNLWERLRAAGIEPITVQPGDFAGSPLSRALYRGARFEGAWDTSDLVDATVSLASEPGRFVFAYVPFVDVAGHVYGQGSAQFTDAMKAAASVWEQIAARLPTDVGLIGTADHGLMEVTEEQKILVREDRYEDLRFAGDPRGLHLWGDLDLMADLAAFVSGRLVDPAEMIGADPSKKARRHLGDTLLLAPDNQVLLPRGFDKRLRCYHGGLMDEEVRIPLLIG